MKNPLRKGKGNLVLKVNILEAKDLVVADARSCFMVAGAVFNHQHRRTRKAKRTANPVWDSSLRLELRPNAHSDIVHIAVFDRHRRYSIYLGELRVSIIDLFQHKDTVQPQWYKLRSSKSANKFVPGWIKVGFQLTSKTDVAQAYVRWCEHCLLERRSITITDQDFYSDDNDDDDDVETILAPGEDDDEDDDDVEIEADSEADNGLEIIASSLKDSKLVKDSLGVAAVSHPYLERDFQSSDTMSSSDFTPLGTPFTSSTNIPKLIHSSSSSSASAILRRPPNYNRIIGVVFLDIISASGLPPYKRFIQKGFDMDPFVVISLGKKTFRTSWRKHTLEPKFNEKLAFEVMAIERNYDLMFNIMDKDHISFHDKVAIGSVSIDDIISKENQEEEFNLKLRLHKDDPTYNPSLRFNIKFRSYETLTTEIWSNLLTTKYGNLDTTLDIMQVEELLEELQIIDLDISTFFSIQNAAASTDSKDKDQEQVSIKQVVDILSSSTQSINLERCPICRKRKHSSDIVTHIAICSSKPDKLKIFTTSSFASKRWYSKVLIKFVYGKYALGKNNANILVQERMTGFIMEEKMSLYIRLGIRLLYKGRGTDSRRIKTLLRNLSVKQGLKFDSPQSKKDIDSFIKFHQLDLNECLDVEYHTFNEFFYRKLKPGARPPEAPEDCRIITSPADCRCTAFQTLESAKSVWVKGRSFTIKKLLGDAYSSEFDDCSIGIFRLAPQDYHRFHSPVEGTVGEPTYISGEYYTVNPMAIRSDLDVYGENVRVVLPIDTEDFGRVLFVAVGAMMVGSTILTVKNGDKVKRTDELGYFKFGGSTCLVLFNKDADMSFDSDLIENSYEAIETLVKVGMSVGHSNQVEEFKRKKKPFEQQSEEFKIKIMRTITGGDHTEPWEMYNLDNLNSDMNLESDQDDQNDLSDDESDESA